MNNSLLLVNKKVVCMVGKVIKKLVKKKVFKLGLTGASLIGLMISSGFSFAKYIDTNYGNGNAGAARFNVTVSNNTKFIYLPDDLSSFSSGYYAFIADFTIDFTDCDVSTQYNLNLKICEEYSTDYDNPYDLKYAKTYFKLPTLSNDQTYTNYTIIFLKMLQLNFYYIIKLLNVGQKEVSWTIPLTQRRLEKMIFEEFSHPKLILKFSFVPQKAMLLLF
jgi:hypothetical protein